jgi:transposase-like protein
MTVICVMALSSESKIKWAEDLYTGSDLNQSEICEIVEISDRTLRDWREKYGWEEVRKAGRITTPKIITKLNQLLYDEMEKEKPDPDQLIELNDQLAAEKEKEKPNPDEVKRLKSLISIESSKSGPDADQIVKYSKSIEYLKNKELVLSDYIKMFRKFTEWLFIRNSEAAKTLNVYMKDFVNFIIHGRD